MSATIINLKQKKEAILSKMEGLFSGYKQPIGCSRILKTGKNKGKRCGNDIKKNGLCSRHQPKVTKKVQEKNDIGECLICCMEGELLKECCSFRMCLSCVLRNGKKECPHCKKNVYRVLPDSVKPVFDIVLEKQKHIQEQEERIRNLEVALTLRERTQEQEEEEEVDERQRILIVGRELNNELEMLLRQLQE